MSNKFAGRKLLAFAVLLVLASAVFQFHPAKAAGIYTWTDQTLAGSHQWRGVASDNTGAKLVAVVFGGDIYTSVDSGAHWTDHVIGGTHQWRAVASDSTGTNLIAVPTAGDIFTSSDSGANWTDQSSAGSRLWISVAMSSNGMNIAAAADFGDIYTSTNGGGAWTNQTGSGAHNWISIASSANGTNLAAVDSGGDVYTSTNSGVAWTNQTAAGTRNWNSIASDSTGNNLVAVVGSGGDIYTSTNGGAAWTDQTAAGAHNWTAVASSSDGSKIAATNSSGDVYTSANGGVAWTDQTGSGAHAWVAITSSSDGSKIAAAVQNGDIYTGAFTVPNAPTAVIGYPGNTTATVIFQAPAYDGGSAITGYTVTTSPAGGTDANAGSTSLIHTVTGLTQGSTYAFIVTPTNAIGTGSASLASPVTTLSNIYSTPLMLRRDSSGNRNWQAVASSASGLKLAAVVNGGDIYTSVDAGATWIDQVNSGNRTWYAITSSADGAKLAAVVNGGDIYTSTDAGATWIDQVNAGSATWVAIASSYDGIHLIALANGGDIYTSTDAGASWTDQTNAGSGNWNAVASSADGIHLVAAGVGHIFTSSDAGVHWTSHISSPSKTWSSLTSSADGSKLAATTFIGNIYASTNSGVNWINLPVGGQDLWRSITSSADGNDLAVVGSNFGIITSVDGGVDWTFQDQISSSWNGIASSSDGSRLVVSLGNDYLRTLNFGADVPNLPTGISATPGQTQATVSWTAPTVSNGSVISDYDLQYRVSGASSWTDFPHTVSNATTQTVAGLTPSTTYEFQVAAINNSGTGGFSGIATAVIPDAPVVSAISGGGGPPTGILVTPLNQTPANTDPISTVSPAQPIAPIFSPSIDGAVFVNDDGTYYIIVGTQKYGVTNPGMLATYGFTLSQAVPITDAQKALPIAQNLVPNDGSLVKTKTDKTVYFTSNGKRYGFVSAAVFLKLGYSFKSVLTVTDPELDQLAVMSPVSDAVAAHMEGNKVLMNGTVYWIGPDNAMHAYPSLMIYNSWNIPGDFSGVVPANAADKALPIGSVLSART